VKYDMPVHPRIGVSILMSTRKEER
jgi:hypothetical protein